MVMFWARIKQVKENPKISSLLFQILFKMYKNDTFCTPWVTTVKKTYWKVVVLQALGNTNVSHLEKTILKSYYSNVSRTNSIKNGQLK